VIESRTTRSFRAAFAALPKEIQIRARRAYSLFREDPGHPGLRFKKVAELENVYSVRTGLGYRHWAFSKARQSFGSGLAHADYDRVI